VRRHGAKACAVEFFARHLMTAGGWERDVTIATGPGGVVSTLRAGTAAAPGAAVLETIVPALPNAHSHAFQRAIAARTQHAQPGANTFWSWRSAMYARAHAIDPDEYERAATETFAEMAAAGYASVAEFHYLHAAPGGTPYDAPGEMSERLVAAAQHAGIGLTLLPVLYLHGDFGGAPLEPGQARFSLGLDGYLDLWRNLHARLRGLESVRLGIAFHSLRAVTVAELRATLDALLPIAPDAPLHIHIAEQQREVEACLATCGARPVELLCANVALSERWCLVHATHASDAELEQVAAARAVVALCPTTEADLGDGIFPARRFLDLGGRIALGSDSNVRIDPAEECRLLEYGQRLTAQARNVLSDPATPSTAETIYRAALSGGGAALGAGSFVEAGRQLRAIALPGEREAALDAYVFASRERPQVL
jgi:formimidoylglutamate deiminase